MVCGTTAWSDAPTRLTIKDPFISHLWIFDLFSLGITRLLFRKIAFPLFFLLLFFSFLLLCWLKLVAGMQRFAIWITNSIRKFLWNVRLRILYLLLQSNSEHYGEFYNKRYWWGGGKRQLPTRCIIYATHTSNELYNYQLGGVWWEDGGGARYYRLHAHTPTNGVIVVEQRFPNFFDFWNWRFPMAPLTKRMSFFFLLFYIKINKI